MKVNYIFDEGSSKEDSFLIQEPVFGLFDGFNGLVEPFVTTDGRTGGLIASVTAKETFAESSDKLKESAIKANHRIREAMLSVGVGMDDKSRLWGTALAVIKVKESSFQWIQIADCLILVLYRDSSFRLLVEDYDHDWEVLSVWKRFAEQKQKDIRKMIERDLISLRRRVNVEYGALTGEPEALNFLRGGEESLEHVSDIIVCSDGLILPKEDPGRKDDWKMFVSLFKKEGLEGIKTYIRNLEKNDPQCWKYPRYKAHDDITGISISFDS